ncbi:MAG TPA: carbonic anhydrase [Pseudonocardiaceae bacterium]|jgi:carbonic anhydrase|nr:carbonic anhydrase [Pseudonocardiaceae bacterium]
MERTNVLSTDSRSDSNFTVYLERNARFAATDARNDVPEIPFIPFRQLYLITCIDPRVEPSAVVGAALGEAIVARNIGGRVTPSVVKDLAWVCYLHAHKAPGADWFEVAIIHHTDCGSGLFADEELRHGFAASGGYDERTAAALAVLEPAETVRADVAALRAAPELAPSIEALRIGGYAYDLATGLLTTVVAPA